MLRRLVQLLIRRPGRLLVAAAVTAVVAAVVGAPVEHLLVPSRADFNDPTAESGRVEASLQSTLGTGPAGGVVALVRTNRDARLDRSSRERVMRVLATLRDDPSVASVTSPFGAGTRTFVSRDGRATYLVATLKSLPNAAIQRALQRLEATFRREPGVTLGGTEVAYQQAGEQSKRDLVSTELMALPVLLIAALLVFGGVVAALLPLLVGALSIVITLAAMRLINEAVPLSNFSLNLVTALALALAIDYSLFIVSRFREELAEGRSVEESLRRTMKTAGRTVLISSLTVGAALASLLVFPQRFLYSMGIGGVLVALTAAAVALTVLPAVLALLGRRIDVLSIRRRRPAGPTAPGKQSGFWYRLGTGVMKRPGPVAALAAVVLIVIALPALRTNFIPFSAAMLPADTGARQVDEALRTEFRSGGSLVTVTVRAPRDGRSDVRRLAATIAGLPGTADVTEARYLKEGLWVIQVVARGGDDTPSAQALVADIRELRGQPPHGVGGVTATSVDKLDSLGARLPLALALIAVTTFLLMFALTGSVVLPLKGLLINLLTIGAAFGVLVLVFQDGYLHSLLGFSTQGGLEATQPVLLFALAFGLSTDYGIFLLARVTEAHQRGMPTREAVVFALQHTGRLITAAALLFCIVIGALVTSPLVVLKLFAVGTTVAVVLDATLARGLLVPALIGLLGPWNWWAPQPLRRLHRKLGLSESLPADEPSDEATDGPVADGPVPDPAPTPIPKENDMQRIALFTAECAQVNPAISEFIRRNHERVELVVTSDVYRGKRFGILRQAFTNFRRSGFEFVKYLSYSFVGYFAYARFDRLRATITRTPRKCLTVAELCESYGIVCVKTADVNGPDVAARLTAADLDAIVIYWFDQIIKDHIIAIPRRGVINVHAALLPFCRGLFPVLYSATKNNETYGISAHEIENTEIDAGPILAQTRVNPPRDRSIIYRDAVVNRAGVDLVCRILDDFDAYQAQRSRPEGGSYFSYPSRPDTRAARRAGVRLASLKDFLAVCRGEMSHIATGSAAAHVERPLAGASPTPDGPPA